MPRAIKSLRVLIVAVSIALAGSSAAQKSLDRDYVAFCLRHMPPPLRHDVEALRYVLSPFELDELLALPSHADRREWIDEYWRLRDPIFTTPENEVRIEHARRVAHAESAFFIPRPPGWDQRGEVYIRYGPPSIRDPIAAETDQSGSTARGEVWFYVDYDMAVLFEDAFSRGEYTYYVERVRSPSRVRLDKVKDPIDAPVRGMLNDLTNVPPPCIAVENEYNEHMEKIYRFYDLLSSTPTVFSYDLQSRQLPFVFSIDNFRGGAGTDRVDVNIEFDAELAPASDLDRSRSYIATAIFWDTARKEVARRERRVEFPVTHLTDLAGSTRIVPVQLVFSLRPGFYFMAVTVEDWTSGKISSLRADAACHDFEGRLSMSDILFAARIEPTERPSPFNRGALEVIPHPLRRYQRAEPIPVYFEVYNLTAGDQGASSYSVEYQVVREEARGTGASQGISRTGAPEISSRFHQSAYDTMDFVHIALRSDDFRAGIYELRVSITDEVSHAETSREATFSVAE